MGRIRNIMLWLMAVIMLFGCAASRKTEGSKSEERRDSTVEAITDSVKKSDVKNDSTVSIATDENHTSATIHRKGDYERNSSYEEHFKHLESTISRMQHTIDSLVLSNRLNVGTHWAKKDSTNVTKEKNTKEIKDTSFEDFMWKAMKELAFWAFVLLYILGFLSWLKDKTGKWLK